MKIESRWWELFVAELGATIGFVLIMIGLMLVFTSCASAQSRTATTAPYVVMIAGNTADLWTTHVALSSGLAHEGNPIWNRQDIRTLAIVKLTSAATVAVIMRVLETQGHTRAAKVVGYLNGGLTFGAAAHNAHIVARVK